MSPWRFIITEEAETDLKRLDSEIRRRVVEKLHWLIDNFEYATPIPLGYALKGFLKLRIGDWRVVYSAQEDERVVTVHMIDHRDKIYKRNIR